MTELDELVAKWRDWVCGGKTCGQVAEMCADELERVAASFAARVRRSALEEAAQAVDTTEGDKIDEMVREQIRSLAA
jgi:hypothetical protein